MSHEKTIQNLKRVARVLEKEYNGEELLRFSVQLQELDDESAEEVLSKGIVIISKRRTANTDGAARYLEQIKPLAVKEREDSTKENQAALEAAARKFCEENPLSEYAWYSHYCYAEPEKRRMIDVITEEEFTNLKREKDSFRKVLLLCVERISLAHEDYDTAFAVYIALEEYDLARGVRYRQGMEAYERGDYEAAEQFFEEALTHEGATEMMLKTAHTQVHRRKFLERVGDPAQYLRQKMDEREPSRMRELRANRHVSSQGGEYGTAWLFFLVGFVLSVIMHTDPGLDNNMLYIFFPIAVSIGIHVMFDMEFGWLKSLAITFGILVLPKIFADFSVDWFGTPTPAFVLLNLLTAVPLVITLIDLFRAIPARRAERRAAALTSELLSVQEKLREELVNEFAPEVGKDLAEKWVKELRSGV